MNKTVHWNNHCLSPKVPAITTLISLFSHKTQQILGKPSECMLSTMAKCRRRTTNTLSSYTLHLGRKVIFSFQKSFPCSSFLNNAFFHFSIVSLHCRVDLGYISCRLTIQNIRFGELWLSKVRAKVLPIIGAAFGPRQRRKGVETIAFWENYVAIILEFPVVAA